MKLFRKKPEKKILRGAAVATAVLGLLVSSAGASARDIVRGNDDVDLPPPPAIVQMLTEEEEDVNPEADEEQEEEKTGFRAMFRRRLLSAPLAVRLCVLLPLWLVGWAVSSLISLLFGSLVSPLLGTLLRWTLIAAAVFGIVALICRIFFPDIPLKEIFTKKRILGILAGAAALAVADHLLQWADAARGTLFILRFCGSLALVAIFTVPLIIKENRIRREKEGSSLAQPAV